MQNYPKRNKEVQKLVRSLLVPFLGQKLMEFDFKSLEVMIAACITKDPTLISYVLNPNSDMHKDTAADIFIKSLEEVTKEERQIAKKFVFAEFYGDWYEQIADTLIEEMSEEIWSNLQKKGIRHRNDFALHLKEVEDIMWFKRFPVYTQWKKDNYNNYLKYQYLNISTGFQATDIINRNQANNLPIQGPAFHCNLWIINYISEVLEKRNMNTKFLGQIHDSQVFSVDPLEEEALINIVSIGLKRLRQRWKWIIVPLTIDYEAAEVGESWYMLKEKGKIYEKT
jgi:DNA polymerase I-like protein with 3'-5' exonuclease and polymerase domains